MKSFVVFVKDTIPEERALTVKWYKTAKQLRASASREAKKLYDSVEFEGVVGLWSPIEIWRYKPGKPDMRKPDFGVMRLCQEYDQGSTVVHEMTHAAMTLYEQYFVDQRSDRPAELAVHHMTSNNEKFAMIMTELYHRIIEQLYETGFYTK